MIFIPAVNCCTTCTTRPCDTCFCGLNLNTAGGDAGYDNTFSTPTEFATARNIYVGFESYTIKDRLMIYANWVLVYDSGCIAGYVSPTILIPAGTTTVRVVVIPNCEGTIGTAWTLTIVCAST